MASTASPPSIRTTRGVAPLRAGKGHSFLLRRLHSLSGIIPVGLFLIEHFVSNAFATKGPGAYTKQVELLTGFPFVVGLELFGIWLPILYHSLYGFYIWYRGDSNAGDYPWLGNWMYTAQRWTGAIAFFYMGWHTWHLRFSGIHLLTHPASALRQGAIGISKSLGSGLLRRGNCLRLMAFCIRTVAVRSQVGYYERRSRTTQIWLCLFCDWSALCAGGSSHHARVSDDAAAAAGI